MKMDSLLQISALNSAGCVAGMVAGRGWKNQAEIYNYISGSVIGGDVRLVSPKQTHGAEIAWLEEAETSENLVADGVLSASPGLCLTVRTADCLPLLLAHPAGLFGAVHVGWRGLAGGILDELLYKVMVSGYSAENINVHLGPSIGSCCFEVGEEVAVLFDNEFVDSRRGRLFVDLPRAARNLILARGVKEANVELSSECTSCGSDRFYSYRRDGSAAVQMVSFIYRK